MSTDASMATFSDRSKVIEYTFRRRMFDAHQSRWYGRIIRAVACVANTAPDSIEADTFRTVRAIVVFAFVKTQESNFASAPHLVTTKAFSGCIKRCLWHNLNSLGLVFQAEQSLLALFDSASVAKAIFRIATMAKVVSIETNHDQFVDGPVLFAVLTFKLVAEMVFVARLLARMGFQSRWLR